VPDGEGGEIFVTVSFERELTVQELSRLHLA
jgi:hypothetical protein